jgi:hypothetical protein
MKKIAYLFLLAAAALGAGEAPSFEQFKSAIRPDHPRLFITADGIPAFRERALGSCRNYFDALKAKVDALPDDPVLTVKPDIAEMKGDVLVFKKNVNDQNAVKYALNTIGGVQALECTIVYLVTNEEQYRQKACRYC